MSAFFADSIQQIYSFRASGVRSSHRNDAEDDDEEEQEEEVEVEGVSRSEERRSAGNSWTTPPERDLGFDAAPVLLRLRARPPAGADDDILWAVESQCR